MGDDWGLQEIRCFGRETTAEWLSHVIGRSVKVGRSPMPRTAANLEAELRAFYGLSRIFGRLNAILGRSDIRQSVRRAIVLDDSCFKKTEDRRQPLFEIRHSRHFLNIFPPLFAIFPATIVVVTNEKQEIQDRYFRLGADIVVYLGAPNADDLLRDRLQVWSRKLQSINALLDYRRLILSMVGGALLLFIVPTFYTAVGNFLGEWAKGRWLDRPAVSAGPASNQAEKSQ